MPLHFSIYFRAELSNYYSMIFLKSFFMIVLLASVCEAKIRNRKVKEAPRSCTVMSEDHYLSRDEKKIFSTERHSLVIDEKVSLIKDKGEKICEWSLDTWNALPPLNQFSFYIDEYKEMLYPYAQKDDGSVVVLKVPLGDCHIDEAVTQAEFIKPNCVRPIAKSSRNKKKRSVARANN